MDMERQIQTLHHELLQELEDIVKQHDTDHQKLAGNTLGSLIHSITDSKLHHLNLELRRHMTARLDALLQDMKDEQVAFQARMLMEMDQRLEQHASAPPDTASLRGHGPNGDSLAWIRLPALAASVILLLMLISWPN